MVRLHVLNNEIIGLSSAEHVCNVCKPLLAKTCVHRVEHSNFAIHNHIGIVRHSVFNNVLTFKQIYIVVIYANILDILSDIHIFLQ